METFSLALLNLKEAMEQGGCPLCRCRLRAEAGFLKSLDWEDIYDIGSRVRLVQSFGACGRHARQMLRMEITGWETPLGNAILYEGLVSAASRRLEDARVLAETEARRRWTRRLLGWLPGRRGRTTRLEQPLLPAQDCRICAVGQESARFHGETLLEALTFPEYQALYERSEGVCLPHLRLLLQIAKPELGLRYLMDQSVRRCEALEADLGEYIRKQSHQYHDEPVSEGQRTAIARAMSFFGGPDAAILVAEGQG